MPVCSSTDHIPWHVSQIDVPDKYLGVLLSDSGDITQDPVYGVVPVVHTPRRRNVGKLPGVYLWNLKFKEVKV